MVTRDKNRCALAFWGVANETQPSEARNAFLRHLIGCCREIDDTRLIVAAFDLVRFDRQRQLFVVNDPFIEELDVVAVNKYMGWYHPWPLTPDKAVWDVARGKPLIISEFGGEALYGQHGPADVASSWSEEYQEALYRDNLRMFENIPNLRGVSPVDSVRFPLAVPLPPHQPGGLEPQGAGFGPGIPQESVVSDESLLRQTLKPT